MSTIAVGAITDASGGATATINAYTPTASNMAGRNRIINGDMRIDQRNAGAAVTPGEGIYTVDRWEAKQTTASKFSVQQSTSSPPVGFINYVRCTSLSAFSVGSSDQFGLRQIIEGLNHSDFNWGSADAKTITISFWVRSSLTGTFGCAFYNYAGDRSYPFTYIISSANTWEKKTVTVAGDTSGTWSTTSTAGICLFFSLGSGSTVSGTAGSWSGSFLASATGATSVVATSGATFDFTGVQLEEGSVATPFEHRSYGTELALCQRYYQQPIDSGLDFFAGYMVDGYYGPACFSTWHCEMRATPTVVVTLGTLNAVGSVSVNYFDKKRFHLNPTANATSNGFWYLNKLTADAEL